MSLTTGGQASLEFRALGLVEVRHEGAAVCIGPPKQRTVLALLLAASGRVVSVDRLLEELWSGDPPASAEPNVRGYAAGLRRALPPAERRRLATVDRGYRLAAGANEIDLAVFETLCRDGRQALDRQDPATADRSLSRALALWRGQPFENVRCGPELDAVARRLEAIRLTAQEDLFEAQLALGDHGLVAPAVRRWVTANPLRERAWAQLALALYRSGDPSAALAACAQARGVLAEELGLEPGPELQRLHQAILDRDGGLDPGPVAAEIRPARPAMPRELPPAPFVFVGRRPELDQVSRVLDRPRPAGVTGLVAVHGPAGTGKSALAVVAAHRLAERYPDGQLFVDLGGPAADGVGPLLNRLLLALGEPADPAEAEPDGTVLRWRSVLAPRRVLIVLDNARSETQIEPILPAGSGCAVIVTSRPLLGGLPASCRVPLGPLAEADAVALLEGYAGTGSLRANRVREVVQHCGGLPGALRRAAGRLAGMVAGAQANA